MTLTQGDLQLHVQNNGAAHITVGDVCFRQYAPDPRYQISNLYSTDTEIHFDIKRSTDSFVVHAVYSLSTEGFPYVRLQLSADATPFQENFAFPPAFIPAETDLTIHPLLEGVRFAVNSPEIRLPDVVNFHSCETSSMSFWALQRADSFILCAVATNLDAGAQNYRNENGLHCTAPFWESTMGSWGYTREIRFYPGVSGGVTGICKAYRSLMGEKGLLVPLRHKASVVPKLNRMAGAADVWLWNDDAMFKLYAPDSVYTHPTPEQEARRVEIAKEMREAGMERVLWSIFDENIGPESTQVKDLGYMTTFYDIYTDVVPKPLVEKLPEVRVRRSEVRTPYWPEGMQLLADGSFRPSWPLKGKDGIFYNQSYMCDIAVLECAKAHIPAHTEQAHLDGRFIDNFYGNMNECYNPAHPATRTQSLEYKNKLLSYLEELGLIVGTEVGREDGAAVTHYNEGMLSPHLFRAYDAGRRMTHLYYGDQVEPVITDYMLNPKYRVPLWELVFHDCVTSYWYWGDSANCCPEYISRRDQFCCLYGLPALYSFDVKSWPQLKDVIVASYQRTSDWAKSVYFEEMTAFCDLTADCQVQKTTFSNGASVIANFSDEPFIYDGIEIPGNHCHFIFAPQQ